MSPADTISLDAPLDELLDAARAKFQVEFEPVAVAGNTLEILQIANMAEYVERLADTARDESLDLPFWAKIWPASMILAHMVAALPRVDGDEMLEIGAGVGICGLAAAATGMRATITDINPDALLFSRINALRNGLDDLVRVEKADFSADRLGRRFRYLAGAEVLYIESTHRGLVKFMNAHLKAEDGAEVVLSRDWRRKSMRFFKLAERDFLMDKRTVGCKSTEEGGEAERYLCDIIRMRPRKKVS